MVKVAILKEYNGPGGQLDSILTMTPDFENIENIDIVTTDSHEPDQQTAYTEDFHLDGVEENIRESSTKLKQGLTKEIPNLFFNSQRYYISLRKKRNFAFLKIRKKKLEVIAMAKEEDIKKKIRNYRITSLSEGVKGFYNGECARIDLTDDKGLNEVLSLLSEIQK